MLLVVVALAVASSGCHLLQRDPGTGCSVYLDGPNQTQYAYEKSEEGNCLLDPCPGPTRYDPQTGDCFNPGLR